MNIHDHPDDGWQLIERRGERPGPEGMIFVFDEEALQSIKANFDKDRAAGSPGLPVKLTTPAGQVQPKIGLVTQLEVKPDGLWAYIEWRPGHLEGAPSQSLSA